MLFRSFGDYIQFARFTGLLRRNGLARLTLVCAKPLQALFETLEGVDVVVTDDAALPAHDFWTFHMSLPLYLRTVLETIPAAVPYLHAPPQRVDRWRHCLPGQGFKVGLVWKGRPTHKNDAKRSLPGLSSLAPLWSVPGVSFVSLQKWQGEEEAHQSRPDQPIVPLGDAILDFADTAAIVAQLDLIVCVDTAIAHLAGALGKPCWVLLPAVGTDWRWLLDGIDSPWYPTVRLFRQSNRDCWRETVIEVAAALRARLDGQA